MAAIEAQHQMLKYVACIATIWGLVALPAQAQASQPVCELARLFGTDQCRPPVFSAGMRGGGLDARMQLVLPSTRPIEYTVVIVGGGLVGYTAFTLDIWRAMCERFRCALAYFDVEPEQPPQSPATDPGRNAALGSGDALLALTDTLARKTSRPELLKTRLALYGFSATGSFGITFASRYPERTLTAVRYHSHLRGLDVDTVALARVPVLLIASTGDSTAGVDDTRRLWEKGRRIGAPWALAIEVDRSHTSLDSWYQSSDLVWRWIQAMNTSRSISLEDGWLGDMRSGAIRRRGASDTDLASWLPDSVTAESWRRLHRVR